MKVEYFNFISSDGITPIEYTLWSPDEEPRAIIQLVHGMSEHIGRYKRFAEFMVENGFAVCGNNHLGHGRSLREGVPGYFGPKGSYRFLVEDVRLLTGMLVDTFGDKPIIIMGHSMGSFITRLYLTRYSHLVQGAIISGTSGTNLQGEFGGYLLTKLLSNVKGERIVDPLVHSLVMGNIKERFKEEDSNAWISTDKEEQAKATSDPMFGYPLTLGGYRELLTMLRLVNSPKWAPSIKTQLPILLFSGEHDPVGQFGKGVVEVRDRLVEAGQTNVTLKLYKEGRHEMLNEVNYDIVQQDVLTWVNSVLEG